MQNRQVLIFARNGPGYAHESTATCAETVGRLIKKTGLSALITDDATLFEDSILQECLAVVFANTCNTVFDNAIQRLAFRRFIESGGLWAGIHGALATEPDWEWYTQLTGGVFTHHPAYQSFDILNMNPKHPANHGLPVCWNKADECYFFRQPGSSIQVLLAADLNTIESDDKPTQAGRYFPVSRISRFAGSVQWSTSLGHAVSDYEDATFLAHLEGGLKWLAQQAQRPDYSKAKALTHDEPVSTA